MPISWIFGERCVRCGATRTKKEYEGVPTCDECALKIKAEREERRTCPTCRSAMEKSVVLNIIVDKCPSCRGAWLDGGELELLREAIKAGVDDDFATGLCLGIAIG